jgi:hypothetical protein
MNGIVHHASHYTTTLLPTPMLHSLQAPKNNNSDCGSGAKHRGRRCNRRRQEMRAVSSCWEVKHIPVLLFDFGPSS